MMLKLSDWANIAEIVSAIALVLTLLYVGYELRLNTMESRLANIHAMTAQSQAIALAIATSSELSKSLALPFQELTRPQVARIRMLLSTALRGAETAHILYSDGLLEERYWRGKAEEVLILLEDRDWQKHWRRRRDYFDRDFATWLDQAIVDRYGS